ncbi:DUF3138 family protein, partial [Vogesella sp. LIG4]|uniref:DUF3138 family protein n=1 Tax=Vogesella sp. LIG4 TaxID=1192162 RepID=UPI0008202154
MKKALIAAIIASLPAAAFADSTADQIKLLQEQLKALQQKVTELEQAKAAPAANAGEDDDNAPARLTQGELQEMKQSQANTKMKVDALSQASDEGPLAGLSITGYLDPVYMYNRNAGSSSFNFVNHSSTYAYDNSSFGDVYLDIKKTFGVGPMAPSIEFSLLPNRGNGNTLLSNDGGSIGNNPINTAQINLPLNESTTFVAGLIPSFGGYEYQQSNQMLTLTHNLLYDFSDPGSYVGAGANYSTGNWAWRFFVGNEQYRTKGASVTDSNDVQHSNKTPTITARADYTWSSALDLGWSVNAGRQTLLTPTDSSTGKPNCASGNTGFGAQCTASSPYSNYYFTEVDATYTLADTQYNAELDYGVQKKAAWNGGDARWYGLSLLAHRKFSTELFGRMGVTARYDYLNNSKNGGGGGGIVLDSTSGMDGYNGFGIDPTCLANSANSGFDCKGANRQDIALDLLFYPTDQVTVKMEYRHDWANQGVFQKADGSASK